MCNLGHVGCLRQCESIVLDLWTNHPRLDGPLEVKLGFRCIYWQNHQSNVFSFRVSRIINVNASWLSLSLVGWLLSLSHICPKIAGEQQRVPDRKIAFPGIR